MFLFSYIFNSLNCFNCIFFSIKCCKSKMWIRDSCEGEFVFGPLCPDRHYAIQIWANATKKIKICAKCHHEGKCLKGDKHDKCDCFIRCV